MKIINKKARFDYHIVQTIEAGIALTGNDLKVLKASRNLTGSYAKIINGEVFFVSPLFEKSKKLLLHKREIVALGTKMKQKRLTLVPVSMYTKHRIFKVELALGKTKRKFEKREAIKKRDLEKELGT
ncbi:hypothetical protein A3D84_00585 [Candidatus Woesebacteria bacterium RIFCSPHIGHO2_02_FULL_42_20]|uniref:SsrA-binding protein n=1 Tax=Candidatus Woesebacteria bacterium RIFCSPHIGHO2_12_FULL_41_24 TaxID=1802510 RepID=A0A1F8AUJ6_9BACT|nr:MAG: hypothetical protein A2W15_02090 [Candidatus Woesebacteria bacterium RBG_16_41_13]OGM29747.1 MAG: hypothetical protein A2873_02510 [Candidatus Woesebacteria bacterium RIFCSPHIGHO2_01_FULL_42_80]OGM35274.1 MAG: hypothetical protein A3D84_00585 [Candidatus Woesebacteria bacterium RIFCSPHIGHO2_02_FULL_42_20]OGM55169.1 MAG: hypothetical protein A3E44_04595 [Candidatus Woesebacteria bacterium RIFCSPHIGHO2_12_FULL_41_24]OGM67741.1 MAG: hypothetical protein A2969_02300 [Candidatus Woesebacteri